MKIKLKHKDKIKVQYASDVYAIMKKILLRENKIDRNKEHFWVIGLNNDSTILFIELVALGSTDNVPVEPMQVFRVAVLKGAVSVIFVHSHASGTLEQTDEERWVLDRLIQSGRILDIIVADHLIITEKEHRSFKETGELETIKDESIFLIGSELEDQLTREGEQMGKLKEKKEIAKALKAKGLDTKIIQETTGLSVTEINEL